VTTSFFTLHKAHFNADNTRCFLLRVCGVLFNVSSSFPRLTFYLHQFQSVAGMFKGGEKNSTIITPKKKKITNEEKYELHKRAKDFLPHIGDLREGMHSNSTPSTLLCQSRNELKTPIDHYAKITNAARYQDGK
jgi:hypothetical protein